VANSDKPVLLIVDDDPLISDTLSFVLGKDFEIVAAESRPQVKSLLTQLDRPPQLALVDLGLPPQPHKPDEGFALISDLLGISPSIKIVVLSGQSDEANARHARALGAIDFVAKPCEPVKLKSLLFNALMIQDAERSAEKTPAPARDSGIVGISPSMDKLRQQIQQYASAPFPVLIEGESGSAPAFSPCQQALSGAQLRRHIAHAGGTHLVWLCQGSLHRRDDIARRLF
jgi:DNA-binding NtrC family response regulator